jgi:Mn2+/Fe2+ NRAMP family transporter
MATQTSQAEVLRSAEPRGIWGLASALGPGIVFLVATIGPRDLIINSVTGATYGYSFLWALVVVALARYVVVEATARYVVATGESLLAGFRHVGAWAGWIILGSIGLKRHFSNLLHILLLGASIEMLAGTQNVVLQKTASLACCAVAFAVMYWGGYRSVERWSKPLAILLAAPFLAAAILARPDPAAIGAGLLSPALPAQAGEFGPALVLLMLISSGVESLSNLKYSSFIYEKGWRTALHIRRQRFDLITSLAGGVAIAALIQIAAAATLGNSGQKLKEVEDLLPIFALTLGDAGRVALALGLWATVFTTYMGSNTGYSLIAADIVTAADQSPGPIEEDPKRRFAYRCFLMFFCLSPLYVLWTGWKPVYLAVVGTALTAVSLPVMTAILLKITSDKRLMRDQVNSRFTSAALGTIILVSLYVTWQSVEEILAGKG